MKKLIKVIPIIICFINTAYSSILVTYPNTSNITFYPSSAYPILWETSVSSSEKVEILLSINNGKDYFLHLITTDNDGVELVTMPLCISNTYGCKIKIRLQSDNSVFDESDTTFTIASTYWSYLIANSGNIKYPEGDTTLNTNLISRFMNPINEWKYKLGERAYRYYTHHTSSNWTGCQVSGENLQKSFLNFTVAQDINYIVLHKDTLGKNNFNITTINKLGGIGCTDFLRSSLSIYPGGRKYATAISVNLKAGEVYTLEVADLFRQGLNGMIELWGLNSDKLTFYEVQTPQPTFSHTFFALDSNLVIKGINTRGKFNLPKGKYKIVGIAYNNTFDMNNALGRKITEINAINSCFLHSVNTIFLEITESCKPDINLSNSNQGYFVEQSSSSIVSQQSIINYSKAYYQAETSILLTPGFEVKKGNVFKGIIKTCQ